jgi:hypothetical protein
MAHPHRRAERKRMMTKKAKPARSVDSRRVLPAEMPQRARNSQGWVAVGNVRVTASEWDLLRSLIATPDLQTATNAELELMRVGRQFSSVSSDIEELMSKGLLMVHGSTKGRTMYPTGAALEAAADLQAGGLL